MRARKPRSCPEIRVEISKEGPDRLKVAVEDNGPGILRKEIPNVFARLLYGSRFHANRQSRGQQGIGISAAVLYAGLTTARPARILSKVAEEEAAHTLDLLIDTQKNLPKIVSEDVTLWDRPSGTRVELLLKAKYQRGRQSPFEYLKGTAIVNPHARLVLVEPDGTRITYERVSQEVPPVPKETPPHPYGLELGELAYRLKASSRTTLLEFLQKDLAGVTARAAREILDQSGLPGKEPLSEIHGEPLEQLLTALHTVTPGPAVRRLALADRPDPDQARPPERPRRGPPGLLRAAGEPAPEGPGRLPVPGRGRPRLRRGPPGGPADPAPSLREPGPAALPAGGMRDHQRRPEHGLAPVRPGPAGGLGDADGALPAARAPRLHEDPVHQRGEGGGRGGPRDRQGADPGAPGGRPAPSDPPLPAHPS